METLINGWLSIWLYVIAGIGIAMIAVTVAKWKKWPWLNRLGALAIIVLVCHVWEEWVFPGGFHYIYNLGSQYPDRYPMSQLTDMITNFGAIALGCIVLFIWEFKNQAGIAIMIFSAFEVVVHIILAFKSYGEFVDAGQSIIYAPGLITSILGFLPVAIGFFVYFIKHKSKPKVSQLVGGIVTLVIGSLLLVQIPEALLKDENSPYTFDDKGFYSKYTDSDS